MRWTFAAATVLLWISFGPIDQSCAVQEIGSPTAGCDTLVICPKPFQPALNDWIEYRHRQGHSICVIAPATTPAEIKSQIGNIAATNPLKFLFLIGDAEHRPRSSVKLPIDYLPAKVNVQFGSEPEIASDNPYADLDGDGLPELAMGRLPADTSDEVKDFLARVITYETDLTNDQTWRQRINLVAGVGGFGGVIDNVLEQTAKQIITDLVPQHYQTSMTFGSWRSPYCPDPRLFSQTTINRFNEGCLFWIYLGHGRPTRLDRVRLPDQSHPILDENSLPAIGCFAGSPIAIFLSCYTGAIDGPQDCLAEQLLKQSGGPIAAICGTRVTMPYAMSLMSLEMVEEYFEGDSETLGQWMRIVKLRMANGELDFNDENSVHESVHPDEYRRMIQGMGKLFSPLPNMLYDECWEHVQLIQLLGDPLLRLKRPESIEVSTAHSAEPGKPLTITGNALFAGELRVELVYRRDRLRQRPAYRGQYIASDTEFQKYQAVYEQSQNLLCADCHRYVAAGDFEITLPVPDDAHGECAIRCLLQSSERFALGSLPLKLEPSNSISPARR